MSYVYNYWRQNCRRRGKTNTVTLEQFRNFVGNTDYLQLKGRTKFSLSIDRIRSDEGYTFSNIRTITVSVNSAKQRREEKYGLDQDDDTVPF